MKRLTEQERIEAALQLSQSLPCGSVRNRDCKNPRGRGDYLCPSCRAAFDAEYARYDNAPRWEP